MQVSQRKHWNSSDKESALSTPTKPFVKTDFQSEVSAIKSVSKILKLAATWARKTNRVPAQKLNEATHETWFAQLAERSKNLDSQCWIAEKPEQIAKENNELSLKIALST